jgi:nicotinate-nucleotide adenylyltransferase
MTGRTEPHDLLLLYGGTFDPVHEGHLAIARSARDALDTTVHLMPAADPPHRTPPGADAHHRARMLDLAVAGERRLVVDRRELEREGRSYTVDTLRALRGTIGEHRPVALLLGADSFIGLPTWKDWRALFDLAHIVIAERPGNRLDGELPHELADGIAGRIATDPAELRTVPAGRVLRLRQPLVDASASLVRALVANGGDWQALVPPPVAGYIVRHRLFAKPGAASAPL